MRTMAQMALVASLACCGTARADLILLGTVSNTWHGTDSSIVDEQLAGDRLLYHVVGLGGGADLFEQYRVTIRLDAPPVTVDQSVTEGDDPDFVKIAELLTDGLSLGDPTGAGLQEISVLGLIGTEEIIDLHVPRISEFDLFGYRVERIDRHVTFSITTSDDPTVGTDSWMGGVYEFWGSVIPEPTTFVLLAVGALPLLKRRRRSETCRTPQW